MENGFSWCLGQDLRGGVVGIVGLGNIGVEIVKRLKGFEINKFLYTARSKKKIGERINLLFLNFEDLIQNIISGISDFLHFFFIRFY